MRQLPFYKLQYEHHHEICRWEMAVLSTDFNSQDFFTFRTQCHLDTL